MIALRIDVKNEPVQKINLAVTNVNQNVGIRQDVITIPVYKDVPKYEGEYEVTPRFVAQTLPTADRLMTKDVIIEEIPYAEVSNNSGGTTVVIG